MHGMAIPSSLAQGLSGAGAMGVSAMSVSISESLPVAFCIVRVAPARSVSVMCGHCAFSPVNVLDSRIFERCSDRSVLDEWIALNIATSCVRSPSRRSV